MFSLIVISHPVMFPGEAAIIQQLFVEGLEYFHLRKPEADEQAMQQLLDAIPAAFHHRIALHGFHHLAAAYGIRRLHFTEQYRSMTNETTWKQLKDKGYSLSTSVHDLQTIQSLSSFFSYTFFSPVFDSISKRQYQGMAGDDFYLHDEQKSVPVIALGGINGENIRKVAAMNFDGAAVLGTIWNEPANAIENYKLIQDQVKASLPEKETHL
ncbi:thiamine phosphate synthase [Niastella caeni]|uniref:Thiamine phosphate synthase n=1 Tax=Niastella caeni TaxID=2569763 RepID=A0A4S8HVK6_9BACT|nr:thiamine phosphate synthase [Niastella caeni]THU39718.1 thiamine phosphate synthase [Niastella caeni]